MNLNKPQVSIIIPCRNESVNIKNTVASLLKNKCSTNFEIIVIDDNSVDNCCAFLKNDAWPGVRCIRPELQAAEEVPRKQSSSPLGAAKARNLGAHLARGKYLVFCDAHLFFSPSWLDLLIPLLDNPGVGAVVPAIAPHDNINNIGYGQSLNNLLTITWNVPKPSGPKEAVIAPGACIAVRRDLFDAIGGFEETFRTWGYEDIEISIKLWLFGYKILVQPDTKVLHVFRRTHPYPVSYNDIYFNLLVTALLHFNEERLARTVKLLKHHEDCDNIISSAILSPARFKREDYLRRRVHDDDWFFNNFSIPF